MKKIIHFVLSASFFIAAAGVAVSCASGGASGPGKAAKQYAEYLAAGKYDRFIEGVYISEDTPADEVEQSKAMLRSLFEEKGAKTLEEKGGVKSVDLVSEELEPDGKTAAVVLKYNYGNGEVSEETMDMILDNGKWKMELKK